MIRIETTAAFDAEGRSTIQVQTTQPVSPGVYPIAITFDELRTSHPASVDQPTSALIERDGLLLINAEPRFDAAFDVVEMIRPEREARDPSVLGEQKP